MGQKSRKGTVVVFADNGCLRLRWRYQGKRKSMSIGLADTVVNRTVASRLAGQIQLDIAAGNYDPSLKRYKPQVDNSSTMTILELFERFKEIKSKQTSKRTLEKYQAALNYLEQFYKNNAIASVDEKSVEKFYDWLTVQKLAEITLKERLSCIREVWAWAVEKDFIQVNPWESIPNRVKVPPKQRPQPFTITETKAIIEGFRNNRYYNYYTDYVEFLFSTGCRTSEAIGLRWKHLNHDCSSVWIGESLSRGVRKATKTNRDRTISLTPHLQKLLLNRKPSKPKPDDLVFPSKTGGAIDDHNFRNRAWVSVLKQAGVKYRKPYNTRHTFISHALESGESPVMVATWTGHDVKTLYENYAGCIESNPRLPDYLN